MPEQTAPAPSGRVCLWCPQPIPAGARSDAKFCGVTCRKRSWRFTSAVLEHGPAPLASNPGMFAYADPPYPGKVSYYTDGDGRGWVDPAVIDAEVDHRELIDRLMSDYPDGWALSTSSEALQHVLRLCPPGVRVGSWHRPVRRVRARKALSAWEPLIVYGGRPYSSSSTQAVLDRVTYEGRYDSYPGALVGMKPPEFCVWMFRQLNAGIGDQLDDLFPGSGAVERAWTIYTGGLTTVPRSVRWPATFSHDDSQHETAHRA